MGLFIILLEWDKIQYQDLSKISFWCYFSFVWAGNQSALRSVSSISGLKGTVRKKDDFPSVHSWCIVDDQLRSITVFLITVTYFYCRRNEALNELSSDEDTKLDDRWSLLLASALISSSLLSPTYMCCCHLMGRTSIAHIHMYFM